MPVVLPEDVDRQSVIERLRDAGIQTSNHYPAAHRFSFYRTRFPSVCLPQTEEFARRELTLPLHPRMDARQVERVVSALASALVHYTPMELLNDSRSGARADQPARA
jgi:dTDP-4-amino-4,6-dideoxygalactose transaminase